MKRRLRMLLVFLVLGAIVNIAVAWGFCIFVSSSKIERLSPTVLSEQLERCFGTDLFLPATDLALPADAAFGQLFVFRGGGSEVVCSVSPLTGPSMSARIIDAGWPLTSLHGEAVFRGTIAAYIWCVPVRDGGPGGLAPLKPIWHGFAINTVFYAFILWLLFAAPFALRRRWRVKRGLCPKCAYPVGTWGGDVCTECGVAVRRSGTVP